MNLDKKISGNMKLAAVATIVIAVCLLFSYLTLDSGSDDGGVRTQEMLGDYVEVGIWTSEGHQNDYRLVLVNQGEQDSEYVLWVDGLYEGIYTAPNGLIVTCVLFDVEGLTFVEKETIQMIPEEVECDVYTDGDKTYWVDPNGLLLKETYSDGFGTMLLSTSLVDDEPPAIYESDTSKVRAGDFYGFKMTVKDVTRVFVTVVEEVDGDSATVMHINYTGSEPERGTENMKVDDILGAYRQMFEIPEGATVKDTRIIEVGPFYALCDVLVSGDDTYYVGHDDSVLYMYKGVDVMYSIIGTSFIYPVIPGYDSSGLSSPSVGDVTIYNTTTIMNDIDDFRITIDAEPMIFVIDSVDGDSVTGTHTGLIKGRVTELSSGKSGFVDITYPQPGSIQSLSLIGTAMGTKLVVTTTENTDNDSLITSVGVFDDVVYTISYSDEDRILTTYLSFASAVGGNRDLDTFEVGDVVVYSGTLDDKDVTTVFQIIFQRQYAAVYETSNHYWDIYRVDPPMSYVGEETLASIYGEVNCKVYDIKGDGYYFRVWMADGHLYPVKYEYHSNGGMDEVATLKMSSVDYFSMD